MFNQAIVLASGIVSGASDEAFINIFKDIDSCLIGASINFAIFFVSLIVLSAGIFNIVNRRRNANK